MRMLQFLRRLQWILVMILQNPVKTKFLARKSCQMKRAIRNYLLMKSIYLFLKLTTYQKLLMWKIKMF
uniref:Putative secreted protein n=1 Tax=Panstrongylus lignarius TaxID=156445 RepID=A0A224Y1K8_9HEMI